MTYLATSEARPGSETANGGAVRIEPGELGTAEGRPLGLLERRVTERPTGWGVRFGLGKRPDRSKSDRWKQLEYLRVFSVRGGARTCMLPTGEKVQIAVSLDGRSHISGVQRCASSASCPNCTPVIRLRRAGEIEHAIEFWRALGKAVVFVTVTLPHQRFHSLEDSLSALQSSWASIWRGKTGQLLNASIGGKHRIRTIEVTWGRENGWHPHVHALLFLDVDEEHCDVEHVELAVATRWRRAVGRETWTDSDGRSGSWRVPTWKHGCTAKLVNSAEVVSQYLTKVEFKQGCKIVKPASAPWGPAQEVVMSDRKQAGWEEGRRTPWDLLAEAADGDAEASMLFREWETATKGKQLIQWTQGAKAALEVDEVSDEEAATVDPATEIWTTIEIDGNDWAELLHTGRVQAVLDQIECITIAVLGMCRMLGHAPPTTMKLCELSALANISGLAD